jgi:hypothetical protein
MMIHRFAFSGLFIAFALIGSPQAAVAAGICKIEQSPNDANRRAHHRDALATLGELAEAIRSPAHGEVGKLAERAGGLIASFGAARDISALLTLTQEIFDDRRGYDAGINVRRRVHDRLDPIARQSTIFDTSFLVARLKAAESLHRRSPNDLDAALTVISRLIRDADICEERRFFLLLEFANQTGKWSGYPKSNPEILDPAMRTKTLKGIGANHLPVKWFALSSLTVSAIDNARFDLAADFLDRTRHEAETLLADPDLGADSRREINFRMETLAPYFRQERIHYYCPRRHGEKSRPCPYQR